MNREHVHKLIFDHIRDVVWTADLDLNLDLMVAKDRTVVRLALASAQAPGEGGERFFGFVDQFQRALHGAEQPIDVQFLDLPRAVRLVPLASQQIAIDLDDGVKANYPKFYPALKKIAGLEATDD